jgi:hypothetical protein
MRIVSMERRNFLLVGGVASGLALTGGGVLIRRARAREALLSRLLADALDPLASNSLRELRTLPACAREEIKRHFHGKCLNVEGFVSHVCSANFGERLGRCATAEERERCFLEAFCGRVTTHAEMLNWVEVIAGEVGGEVDAAWDHYSAELSLRWDERVRDHGGLLAGGELTRQLTALIRADLAAAARQAVSAHQEPAVGQTIGKIGASAVLLLPLVRFGKPGLAVGIPVFVLLAAREVWNYVAGLLTDRRAGLQAAISARLAQLGNLVGAELEGEVRRRLTDLHTWRERAIRQTATRLTEERVGLI